MRIAQVAPIWKTLPPRQWGGTERVVTELTEGLVKKGHDVTLFATADSQTSAHLFPTIPTGVLDSAGSFQDSIPHLYHVLQVLKKQNDFDIIHFHFTSQLDYDMLALIRDLPRSLVTLHVPLPIQPDELLQRQMLEGDFGKITFVSISDNQRRDFAMNFVATVPNGINHRIYTFNPIVEDSYLLWLSRISRLKGTREAIEVALACQRPLTLIGNPNLKAKPAVAYFEEIKPLLSNRLITYKESPLTIEETVGYYQKAKAFLFPPQWEEPFGLVVVEAMACGTPVIALARGAMPEVIRDGKTGFLVNPAENDIRGDWIIKKTGTEGLREAVERIYSLSSEEYLVMRSAVREHVESYFTSEKMVASYLSVYEQMGNMNEKNKGEHKQI